MAQRLETKERKWLLDDVAKNSEVTIQDDLKGRQVVEFEGL